MSNTNTQQKVFEWNDKYVIEIIKDLLKGNTDLITDHKQYVENVKADLINKEKKIPIEEERIKVGKMSCREWLHETNGEMKWELAFRTNRHIHYDKSPDVCNLLERYFNGEMDNPAPQIRQYPLTEKESVAPTERKQSPLNDIKGNPIFEGDTVKGVGKHIGQSEVFFDAGKWQPFDYLNDYNGENYEIVAPTLERNAPQQKDSIEDKAKQLANEIFLKVLSELDKNK